MRRFVLAAILPLIAALATAAQPTAETPEAVAHLLFEAYRDADFARAAALMHPEALAGIRTLLVDLAALDSTGEMLQVFAGTADPDVLAQMSAEDVFARFIGTVMKIQPEMEAAFRSLEVEALGTVYEGDALAHVVTRNRISMLGATVTQMEVVSVQRHGEGWRALLSGSFENLAAALRAQVEAARDE